MKKPTNLPIIRQIVVIIGIIVIITIITQSTRHQNVLIHPYTGEIWIDASFSELVENRLILSDPMECTFTIPIKKDYADFFEEIFVCSEQEKFFNCDPHLDMQKTIADGFAFSINDSFNSNSWLSIIEVLEKCLDLRFEKKKITKELCLLELDYEGKQYKFILMKYRDIYAFVSE